jgi:hypothetical protein
MQPSSLDPFINDLLEEKGYADAQSDVKESLQADLRKRVNEFIMARTITQLSEEDLTTFEKMLDEKKSSAELQQFAVDHIPDYTTFLASTLVEFQDVFLANN